VFSSLSIHKTAGIHQILRYSMKLSVVFSFFKNSKYSLKLNENIGISTYLQDRKVASSQEIRLELLPVIKNSMLSLYFAK
jgi:hypothetical protein